jgi:hypothetical protein
LWKKEIGLLKKILEEEKMFNKYFALQALIVLTFFFSSMLYAGKVELTTYYPAPYGEYKNLTTTDNTYLATTTNKKVGIGTTSPEAKLHVQQGDILLKANADDPGDIIFKNSVGTQKARIWSNPVAGENGLNLSGSDSNADMTIAGNGNVGIGITNPAHLLTVKSPNGAYATLGISNGGAEVILGVEAALPISNGNARMELRQLSGGGTPFIDFSNDATADYDMRIRLTNDNTLAVESYSGAGVFTHPSDSRIKLNQRPLDYGLAEIMKLQPKRYDVVSSPSDPVTGKIKVDKDGGKNDFGLVAQDVFPVIPEAVSKPDDESKVLWGMVYDKLTPVLVKAIQEQQEEIALLKKATQEQQEEIKRLWAAQTSMNEKGARNV